MSRMAEIDMMVDEVVEMVEDRHMFMSTAMLHIQVAYATTEAEYDMVEREADKRLSSPTI